LSRPVAARDNAARVHGRFRAMIAETAPFHRPARNFFRRFQFNAMGACRTVVPL